MIESSDRELRYLETFRAVCVEGGFTAAARRLGCTQPAVSYQIQQLEAAFGAELLERSGRRVILTRHGERFRDFVEGVFSGLADVRRECTRERVADPLRLGSASGFGRYVLIPALHELRREYEPDLEIRLQYDAADTILSRLEAGDYDGAFVFKRRMTNALTYQRVYDEELVLVGSQFHANEMRSDAGLSDLSRYERLPFVTYEECEYVFGRWFDAVVGTQPSRINSRCHFTELEEVIDFVCAGVGLSIVPRDAAETALRDGRLVTVTHGAVARCFNEVFMVTRSGSRVPSSLKELADLVTKRGGAGGAG